LKSPDDFAPTITATNRFQGNFVQNLKLVERIKSLAAEKGLTRRSWRGLGDGARRGYCTIPGTKRRKYLEENIAAAEVTLSPEDLKNIAAALPRACPETVSDSMMKILQQP
jgi:aryl-alcohol dehydrogenase-like predicted oxidoreductase